MRITALDTYNHKHLLNFKSDSKTREIEDVKCENKYLRHQLNTYKTLAGAMGAAVTVLCTSGLYISSKNNPDFENKYDSLSKEIFFDKNIKIQSGDLNKDGIKDYILTDKYNNTYVINGDSGKVKKVINDFK